MKPQSAQGLSEPSNIEVLGFSSLGLPECAIAVTYVCLSSNHRRLVMPPVPSRGNYKSKGQITPKGYWPPVQWHSWQAWHWMVAIVDHLANF
jgi:hypothetical protein